MGRNGENWLSSRTICTKDAEGDPLGSTRYMCWGGHPPRRKIPARVTCVLPAPLRVLVVGISMEAYSDDSYSALQTEWDGLR